VYKNRFVYNGFSLIKYLIKILIHDELAIVLLVIEYLHSSITSSFVNLSNLQLAYLSKKDF